MQAVQHLMTHIRNRPAELADLKKKGARVIGYIANGYVPEELLYASGATVVGLLRGGDHEAVIKSEACLQRFVDTFCRAQVGYRLGELDVLYQLPDALVVAYTDRNQAAIGEMWELYTPVTVIKLDVPRYNHQAHAVAYYLEGLRRIRQRLEEFTGDAISDESINREIRVSNHLRGLFQIISDSRRADSPPISGGEFVRLQHASLYADRTVLTSALETAVKEVANAKLNSRKGPRIMLTGSTLAEGDYKTIDLLEEYGASVVIEEFTEGIDHYRTRVEDDDDPVKALANRYLSRQLPPPFFKSVTNERFEHLDKLIDEYRVDGVVWYNLMYRDAHDREAVMYHQRLAEKGLPFLKLTSDYDDAEIGPMRTRVEAFLESITQRRRHV